MAIKPIRHVDGLVQERRNSSALALELRLFVALTYRCVINTSIPEQHGRNLHTYSNVISCVNCTWINISFSFVPECQIALAIQVSDAFIRIDIVSDPKASDWCLIYVDSRALAIWEAATVGRILKIAKKYSSSHGEHHRIHAMVVHFTSIAYNETLNSHFEGNFVQLRLFFIFSGMECSTLSKCIACQHTG